MKYSQPCFLLQAHSNETIGSVRWKIAKQLCSPVDSIQIFTNDSLVGLDKRFVALQPDLNAFSFLSLSIIKKPLFAADGE